MFLKTTGSADSGGLRLACSLGFDVVFGGESRNSSPMGWSPGWEAARSIDSAAPTKTGRINEGGPVEGHRLAVGSCAH